MHGILLFALIAGPVLWASLVYFSPNRSVRSLLVTLAALMTAGAGVMLAINGKMTWELTGALWPNLAMLLEYLIVFVIIGLGLRIKSLLVATFGLIQLAIIIAGSLVFKSPAGHHEAAKLIIDPLSIILVLIVSIIGSLIVIYAIGYMRKHEAHAPATSASTNRFFFYLVAFLGFMNGLVLVDDMKWLSIFWELTTLCSFFLIGHEGTEEAQKSARRALIINAFGGVAMSVGVFSCQYMTGHESLALLVQKAAFFPIALLCLATMTKSAQMPFQSWLLGAMVAPTPVSALLHSSTMVKAGSYLILRLAPSFGDSTFGTMIAIAGGFTFVAASAMAISQGNAKRVLAYSTIANLGLIVACAGLNTPIAFAAALMILCFHAVSKALLFLCVGTIEQEIGSRQIEDMGGLLYKMPLTTSIASLGMVSMVVPPFGMLIGKWMAIEAAVDKPMVLTLMVVGSALTIFFWAKWLGRISTTSYHPEYKIEKVFFSQSLVNIILIIGIVLAALCVWPIYRIVVLPIVKGYYAGMSVHAAGMLTAIADFNEWPMYVVLGVALFAVLAAVLAFKPSSIRPPYMCGENAKESPEGAESYAFIGPMDTRTVARVSSYYLSSIFGEEAITKWANTVAVLIIITLFGVLVK